MCPGRSAARNEVKWCAADPGPLRSVAVPDQRCSTRASALALHRVRDTCCETGESMNPRLIWLRQLIAFAVLLAVWEGAGRAGLLNPLFAPSPSRIGAALVE